MSISSNTSRVTTDEYQGYKANVFHVEGGDLEVTFHVGYVPLAETYPDGSPKVQIGSSFIVFDGAGRERVRKQSIVVDNSLVAKVSRWDLPLVNSVDGDKYNCVFQLLVTRFDENGIETSEARSEPLLLIVEPNSDWQRQ